jgi:RNA polymerase sigma factor (sigma-70 family)
LLDGWRERWNRSLLQFLRRRVHAPVDIEDLAQETYLRLLRARDLSEVRNPQAYLLRVASHVVTEWRTSIRTTESLSGFAEGEGPVDESLPEFELEASISQERLEQALHDMSAPMRAAVVLRLRDHHSNKQIAQELGISDRQVRRYLARGYERLRGSLED